MEGKQVRYRVEGSKATLTIDREPSRNALSLQVLEQLAEGIDAAEADGSVRVIVLTGAGDKAFCAGADLGGMGGGGFLASGEWGINPGSLSWRRHDWLRAPFRYRSQG